MTKQEGLSIEPKRLHETQPARPTAIPQEPFNEHLATLQRIEGALMKPVNKRQLPPWLQVVGYFFGACLFAMGVMALYLNIVG